MFIDSLPQRLRPQEVREAYLSARRRLLILDYDGTLVPFVDQPQDATPPPAVIELLNALASEPRNCVALISGRSADNLDDWFGPVQGIWLAAEHGAKLKPPSGSAWKSLRAQEPSDWKAAVSPILEQFVDRTPGSFVEEKQHGLVWHYRTADAKFGDRQAKELALMLDGMLAGTEVQAIPGAKIIEVRPTWANKGHAVERVLATYSSPDFVFAAGDDRTDEDLFERLRSDDWTVHVGPGPTRAAFGVPDFAALREILEMFRGASTQGNAL